MTLPSSSCVLIWVVIHPVGCSNLPYGLSGDPENQGVGRHIVGNHRPGANYTAVTNRHSWANGNVGSQPAVVANCHRLTEFDVGDLAIVLLANVSL